MVRIRVIASALMLLAFQVLAPGQASAAQQSCGTKNLAVHLPLVAGEVFTATITIDANCEVSVSDPRKLTKDEVIAAKNSHAQNAGQRKAFKTIGSTKRYLDPDYHIDSHLWDNFNLILTQLHSDLSWTTDGSSITGWNSGGWTTNHPGRLAVVRARMAARQLLFREWRGCGLHVCERSLSR